MASTRSAIVASYRAVYKAGLAAVQYSSPARFAIRDKVRKAFRSSDASQFSQQRVDNTVEFLKIAGKRKGIEHDIVRNLCLVHYWQVMGKKNRRIEGYETAYSSYYEIIGLLNQSMELELR